MPHEIVFFVGPYAEWEVPTETFRGMSEAAYLAIFEQDHGPLGWLPELRYTDQRANPLERCCAFPRQERDGRPLRPMLLHWWPRNSTKPEPDEFALDCRTLDREAEIAWFREAFKKDLAVMAEALKASPVSCWGIVHWARS